LRECEDDWEEVLSDDIGGEDRSQGSHAEEWGQSMEVVLLDVQTHQLREDLSGCPLGPEQSCQFLQNNQSLLSDLENAVVEPGDADWSKLIVEVVFAELLP